MKKVSYGQILALSILFMIGSSLLGLWQRQ